MFLNKLSHLKHTNNLRITAYKFVWLIMSKECEFWNTPGTKQWRCSVQHFLGRVQVSWPNLTVLQSLSWSFHSSQAPSELRTLIRAHEMQISLCWLLALNGSQLQYARRLSETKTLGPESPMGLVSNRAGGGSWVTNLQALLLLSRYCPWSHLPEDISLLATIFLPPRKGAHFVLPACLSSSCRVEWALGIKGHAW